MGCQGGCEQGSVAVLYAATHLDRAAAFPAGLARMHDRSAALDTKAIAMWRRLRAVVATTVVRPQAHLLTQQRSVMPPYPA